MKNSLRACLKKKLFFSFFLISAALFGVPGVSATQTPLPFTDVPADSAFFIPISYLKEHDLVKGYPDSTFRPEEAVSRAEALAMILKVTGLPKPPVLEAKDITTENPLQIQLPEGTSVTLKDLESGETTQLTDVQNLTITLNEGNATLTPQASTEAPFLDVLPKHWFYDLVMRAKYEGIIKGYEGGKYFRPGKTVNLAEALRILYQASKGGTRLNDEDFKKYLPPGIEPGEWYAQDIAKSVFVTLLMQREDGHVFPPWNTLNRGELALILYRFIKIKEGIVFGNASWYGDGLSKIVPKKGLEYYDRHLTTAHKTLPIGTIIRVTNMNNGKYVDVVVNDRGPFVPGRIVDLSNTAFYTIADWYQGIVPVQMEVREE